MKIITATAAFNAIGREDCIPAGEITHAGRWAIFIRPSGAVEALNVRVASDSTYGQFLAVVEVAA
jgi:hypothetical protein